MQQPARVLDGTMAGFLGKVGFMVIRRRKQ